MTVPADRKGLGGLQRLGLGLAALVLVLDQLSKWLILDLVLAERRFVEVTSFFNIVLVYNRGVSFGMFAEGAATWQPWALSALAIAISLGLVYWLWQIRHWLPATAIGLIIGGALGNTVDRLFRAERAVVDFLDFHGFLFSFPPLNGHWPAFNLADSAIVVGVLALVYDGLFLQQQGDTLAPSGEGRKQGDG
ncbi:MAG: signal peptidase II [Kiloniellales bacterium]|nr:signal peptidase II [Kiloniellales bacterium]